jgi:hypothetical protein
VGLADRYAAGVRFRRRIGRTVPIAVAAIALTGCGSSSQSPTSTAAKVSSKTLPTTTLASQAPMTVTRPAPPQPHVGATLRVHTSGTVLAVTVTKIIDPLTDSGAALLPGMRTVGVLVALQNNGSDVYDSSATGDFSIVASSGATTPEFAPSGVCQTPLRDFDNYITNGEQRSGCVVFALGDHARLLAVRFSPHGQPQGRVTWLVAG